MEAHHTSNRVQHFLAFQVVHGPTPVPENLLLWKETTSFLGSLVDTTDASQHWRSCQLEADSSELASDQLLGL